MGKTLDKILKKYPEGYKKFRRSWVNIFRPLDRNSSSLFLRMDPMAYIGFGSFLITSTMYINGISEYISAIPFIAALSFLVISNVYFKIFPLTWEEMDEIEKSAFRYFWKLPENWEPNK